MEKPAHAASNRRTRRWAAPGGIAALVCHAGLLCCPALAASGAAAASLSPQELQVLGHAVGFLQPPLAGGTVAVVYRAGDAASRRDAEAIAGELGSGLQAGQVQLPAQLVADDAVGGGGFAVAIAAAGAATPGLGATLQAAHLLCVTADAAAVQAGFCTMGIITRPRVEILLNHAAAAASGIDFAIAFRMMIREM